MRPAELAEAVVLADLSLALTVVGQVVPLGTVLIIAAVVPFAIVSARHRFRAVVAGAVAAAAVGFLVIGTAALTTIAACAAFGALVGAADRRHWSSSRTMLMSAVVLWPPIALIADLLLLVFSNLRKLTLDQIRNGWNGLFHILENIGLKRVAHTGQSIVAWVVDNWWISIPLILLAGVLFGTWLAYGLATPALQRVRAAFGPPVPEPPPAPEPDAAPAPVPASFERITYRYPNATHDALAGVSLAIEPGELVTIVGRNGSGKSTLARIIAGRRAPAGGEITRPGPVGLGRLGGTALVFQRPEAQVLGVRVRDDVVWGLVDPDAVDVEHALARVGLLPLADRETATLSGGELQRLAIAAAIARSPQLLVSDESTAMIDADGRVGIVELLRRLADDGVSVVHVSHAASEAAIADRTIVLDNGLIAAATPMSAPSSAGLARSTVTGRQLIVLNGVGHVYSRGTPWANRALADVDLTIRRGESLLVVGHNGSGKTTLAWIMAGLIRPTDGEALVDGVPIADRVGTVALAFQHARLQLLRPVVIDEVRTSGHVGPAAARVALRDVGLGDEFAHRRVDELSGGQLRRVVLAAVLARGASVIVLDEPFAGLDAEGRADLEALLVRLRAEHGIALVIVSHDYDLPPGLVERVVELEGGRIVRDERVDNPVDEATP